MSFVMPRSIVICTAVLLITGCRSIPPYNGDGQISNTTHWADNIVRVRQYTIQLPSFPLNENSKGEFHLGDVAFFRKTRFGVSLRFPDNHDWDRFSQLDQRMKRPKYVAQYRLRDIDRVEGWLSFQVLNGAGEPLLQSDNLLRNYGWSGAGWLEDGWHLVELYVLNNRVAGVPKGDDLTLRFSYSGDPSLTNRGYITLELWPK